MGIPTYFKYITDNHTEIIENCLNNFHSYKNKEKRLFLDLNCAIHKCCRNILNQEKYQNLGEKELETNMFEEVINYIHYIISKVEPSFLFIAIDGVAPRAKMSQQRLRRFKSIQEKNILNGIYKKYDPEYKEKKNWDTNKITPGTEFMQNLSNHIINNMKSENVKIILSDSNQPGEGEHKIIQYIKNNEGEFTNIIYGLDADLIMLSMMFDNVYLLRESLEFGNKIEHDEEGNVIFLYLSINELKDSLHDFMIERGIAMDNIDKNNIIKDYIFICFFLGNDFLPHIESLNIKEGGIDKIIDYYIEIYNKTRQYIIIKDCEENIINLPLLKILLNKMKENEDQDLRKITDKNIKNKVFLNHLKSDIEKEIEKLNKYPIINNSCLKKISMGYPGWEERYYNEIFNIENKENIKEICINYFEGLYWNMKYYFESCKSWSWFYKYSNSPTLNDLEKYLDFNINKILKHDNEVYTPFEQLMLVLPPQSSSILPDKIEKFMTSFKSPVIEYYPIDYRLETLNKIFYWQCHPVLPIINDTKIKDIIKNTNFTEEEKKRNEISQYYKIN
jgi:5'-3' exonuclease